MYTQFFKLKHSPFSIAPDPRFLFMSDRHREALAHLLYGVSGGGGFVLLTGEIGAGKTTVCRCFLEQIPKNCNVGYIFNPKLTVDELLRSICDEFQVNYKVKSDEPASVKTYVDALNAFFLESHAAGRHNVLIIDEAQSLSSRVLEQLRLLTNLETNERKLLQIILIGQPELRALVEKPRLKQLAQRIIARYHLDSLSLEETGRYIRHRLAVAGIKSNSPLPSALAKPIYILTQGVPRRINLLCDRALLGAYSQGKSSVSPQILRIAAREVFGRSRDNIAPDPRLRIAAIGMVGVISGVAIAAAAGMAFVSRSTAVAKNAPPITITGVVAPVAPPTVIAPPKPAPTVASQSAVPTLDMEQATDVQSTNAQSAFKQLAKLWGDSLPSGDPCDKLPQANLRCFSSTKGFSEIRQLDRPVLLHLRDTSDKLYFALLTGLTDNQASLTIGERNYVVSLIALARHFDGEFTTLWRVPAGFREKIHHGDQGADVDWIAAQLAKLNGEPTPVVNQPFSHDLILQIREFQSAQGMDADGVIGPKTYMQLNRATNSNEPRLHHTLAIAQESIRK